MIPAVPASFTFCISFFVSDSSSSDATGVVVAAASSVGAGAVSVDEARSVDRIETGGEGMRDFDEIGWGERATGEAGGEGLAFDVLHNENLHGAAVAGFQGEEFIDAAHAGVLDAGGGRVFRTERAGSGGDFGSGVGDFEGDGVAGLVLGLINGAGAAVAEFANDAEASAEGGASDEGVVVHAGCVFGAWGGGVETPESLDLLTELVVRATQGESPGEVPGGDFDNGLGGLTEVHSVVLSR